MLFAAPPDRISLAGAAAFSWGTGGNLVPAGGFRALLDRLSTGLDVRLGTVVTAVEHGAAGVVVDSDGGTFEGDQVVVTVPLGVLKTEALSFDPPLGADHLEAVERLAMGTLEKIALRFPERFWAESIRQITHVSDDRAFPDWVDFSRHVGSPTLVAFHNPSVTPGLTELPAEQRVGLALDVLRKMFGPVPDPDEALVTDRTRTGEAARAALPRPGSPALDGNLSPQRSSVGTAGRLYGTYTRPFCSGLRLPSCSPDRGPACSNPVRRGY